MPSDPKQLAQAYLQHMPSTSENDWAYDELSDRVFDQSNGADAWELILALVEGANEENLGIVGAGPLEDFVRIHGKSWVEPIETAARRDPKFRAALGCIWLSRGDLPPDVLDRVVVASGGAIHPLDK